MSFFGEFFGPSGSFQPGDPVEAPDTDGPVRLALLGADEAREGANWPPIVFQVRHGPRDVPLPIPDPTGMTVELRAPGGSTTYEGMPEVIDPVEAATRWGLQSGLSVMMIDPAALDMPSDVWPAPGTYSLSLWLRYDGGKEILAPSGETGRVVYVVHPRHIEAP
jgi:hypothetical protein